MNDASSARAIVRLDGLRVLVVDDEPDPRRMLLKVLEGVEAHVTVAGTSSGTICLIDRMPHPVAFTGSASPTASE